MQPFHNQLSQILLTICFAFQPHPSGSHVVLAATYDVINPSTFGRVSCAPSKCHVLLSIQYCLSMNRQVELCLAFPRLICR